MRVLEDPVQCVHSVNVSVDNLVLESCGLDLNGQLMGDEIAGALIVVFQVALTGILAVSGMVTNTINIIVFIKMGLNDAVNVSLLGLAVADFCALVCSFWEAICFNPLFEDTMPVVFNEIEYITGCWPHVCFVRVASYITAFITFERCLCIALPLKVKSIITTRRAKAVVIAVFFVVLVSSAPEYYVNQLVWKFYPEKNRTMLGIYFIENREQFENVTVILNNVLLQCISFIFVVVCTTILVVQLNRKAKWRQQSVKGDNTSSTKEKKVVKMITFISSIFIISNLPSCIVFVAMSMADKLHPTGVNYNLFYLVWALVYVLEGINSTVNTFVYLNMSSKYRSIFYNTILFREFNRGNSKMSQSQVELSSETTNVNLQQTLNLQKH